jgi:hypothetical protein
VLVFWLPQVAFLWPVAGLFATYGGRLVDRLRGPAG